tara:strand:- start:597 stop:929 length:333 start_codon:yes stop_codon:yes gene_type:complete
MKQLFTLLAAVFFTLQIQAQCITGMPVDTFVCPSAQTQYVVPGSPTLIGGTPPLTYVWAMDTSTLSFNYPIYASDILNDTTISPLQLVMTYFKVIFGLRVVLFQNLLLFI